MTLTQKRFSQQLASMGAGFYPSLMDTPTVDHVLACMNMLEEDKVDIQLEYAKRALTNYGYSRNCHLVAHAVIGALTSRQHGSTEARIKIAQAIEDLTWSWNGNHEFPSLKMLYTNGAMTHQTPSVDDVLHVMGLSVHWGETYSLAFKEKVSYGCGYASNCHLVAMMTHFDVIDDCVVVEQGMAKNIDEKLARKIIAFGMIKLMVDKQKCLLDRHYTRLRYILGMSAPDWASRYERAQVVSQCMCDDCIHETMDPSWRFERYR